jgi:death on curing protein
MTPRFLSVDRLRQIHLDQVQRYGGEPNLRDLALLESAAATPMASFADAFLHAFPEEMAAAYLFHLVSNPPFVDGNKRVSLAAALIFLWINGYELKCEHSVLEELVVSVAKGEKSKAEVAIFIKAHLVERRT